MHWVCAIGAALLLACGMSTASRADDTLPEDAQATLPLAASAGPAGGAHHVRPHRRYYRMQARYYRRRAPRRMMVPAHEEFMPPPYYDPPIPSAYDSAYDRAMILHYRSPAVSGVHIPEPGLPYTPPVVQYQSYRLVVGNTVMQFDGLTGQYMQMSQRDSARILSSLPITPAAPEPEPAAK